MQAFSVFPHFGCRTSPIPSTEYDMRRRCRILSTYTKASHPHHPQAPGPKARRAHRHQTETGIAQRRRGIPTGGRVSWRAANPAICRARQMEANPSWQPVSSGPLGCGIPKVPHCTFGAEGVHRGSGDSGPCENSADGSLQRQKPTSVKKDKKRQQYDQAQPPGSGAKAPERG